MSKTISPAEVAAHKDADKGMWIIVDDGVYDVTGFIDEHPGGPKILKRAVGKDASKQFWKACARTIRPEKGSKANICPIVSQRKRVKEVPGEAENRDCRGEGQVITYQNKRENGNGGKKYYNSHFGALA